MSKLAIKLFRIIKKAFKIRDIETRLRLFIAKLIIKNWSRSSNKLDFIFVSQTRHIKKEFVHEQIANKK